MIIGTVTALMIIFGGGGSFSFEKAYEPYLKEVVQDELRREQTLDLAKKADEELEQFQKEVEGVWSKDLKAILEDYDATEEDFRKFVARADQSRFAAQQKIVDLRFKVLELMTEDEWAALYAKVDEAAIKAQEKKKDK